METKEDAKKLMDFYVDLVENNNTTAKYHLAENVVLDWFGKTIKDNKKVSAFINEQVCKVTHQFTNVVPSENVAFKETHNVKVPKCKEERTVSVSPIESETTSPKITNPSTSTLEMGQGDGLHNCPLLSPPKKMKYESDDEGNETMESETETLALKYVTAEGTVEFHRPSIKKFQTETRWRRPVKLHIGYTTTSYKNSTIYLIIYEGNLKCRRNLYSEFCKSDASSKAS